MGSAVSVGLSAAVSSATKYEIVEAIRDVDPEDRSRIADALEACSAPAPALPPLIDAIAQGKVDVVRQHAAKASMEQLEERGNGEMAPLHHAAGHQHLEMVRVLLGARVDPNQRDADGDSPLTYASFVETPNLAIVTALLEARANPSNQGEGQFGKTPLVYACDNDYPQQAQLVQALVSARADPDMSVTQIYRGTRPLLHYAVSNGQAAAAKILLDVGADVHAKDHKGLTVLNHDGNFFTGKMDPRKKLELVQILVSGRADVNSTDGQRGITPLETAVTDVRHASDPIALSLLEAGAKVTVNAMGDAIKFGRMSLLKRMIEARGDINERSSYGWNALSYAAACSTTVGLAQKRGDFIKFLVEQRGDVSVRTQEQDRSAILLAASGGQATQDVLDVLLAARADIHDRDCNGWTPLLLACEGSHADIAQALIERRADVNAVITDSGLTPMHLVAVHCFEPLLQVAKRLIDAEADLAIKDKDGMTALDLAEKCKERLATAALVNLLQDASPMAAAAPPMAQLAQVAQPQEPFATAGPPGGAPSSPVIDGKEFFRQARSRLSDEAFNLFLSSTKRLNNQQQSREETLEEARRIFGTELQDLYRDFENLLNRQSI